MDGSSNTDGRQILADLKAFWENPRPGILGVIPHGKLAGSKYDQAVPDGIQNPYWEIIRLIPYDGLFSSLFCERQEPPDYAFIRQPDGTLDTLTSRDVLCHEFAWAIPSPEDMAFFRAVLKGRKVVEVGAGGGYWVWQLQQAGIDAIAYDPLAGMHNPWANRQWSAVERGDHNSAALHPDRALFICWPNNRDQWAAKALTQYAGDLVIYCGIDHCCAEDSFYRILDTEWQEVASSRGHVSFVTVHSRLTAYRRRKTEGITTQWELGSKAGHSATGGIRRIR